MDTSIVKFDLAKSIFKNESYFIHIVGELVKDNIYKELCKLNLVPYFF